MCTIRFISDTALPQDHDFVVVELEGDVVAFLRESAITPANIEAACHAMDALKDQPQVARSA
jgi:hypothetical protein